MAFGFRRFLKGILLRGESSDPSDNLEGSLWHNDTDNKLKTYINGAARQVVTDTDNQVLFNKTIDADNTTISNLEVDNLKAGVLDTDLNAVSASDDTIPSAKAVKDYIDQQDDAQNEAFEIGYTPGDNSDWDVVPSQVKAGLDELAQRTNDDEDALATHIADTTTHGTSGDIVGTTDSQTLESKNLKMDTNAFVDASDATKKLKFGTNIHNTGTTMTVQSNATSNRVLQLPDVSGTLMTSSNTTAVLNKSIAAGDNTITGLTHGTEVDNPFSGVHGVTGNVVGTTDSQTLTNKTHTSPVINTQVTGDALETDLAVSALSTKIANAAAIKTYADSVASTASGDLSTHISDTSTHGITSAIVGESETQTLTNKTIDADNNTISNLAHGAEVDNPTSGVHGVTGDVVGTSDSQTLTNKTIAAGSNTISGLSHGSEVDNPTSGVHGVTGNVVGTSDTQTLTNKTIDVDNNTISNIEVDNLKAGVLDIDLSTVSGSDDTLASAKAIKSYVDTQVSGGSVIKYDSGWVTVSTINDTPATGTHRLTTTLSAYPSQISLTLDDGTNIFPGDLASRIVFREITGTYYVEVDTDGLDSTDQFRVHAWV